MLPSIINSPTKFDFGWLTLLITSLTVTSIQAWCTSHKTTIGSKSHHTLYKLLTIKNNQYNNKHIAVISHVPLYHVIQCNLIFTVFYNYVFHKFIVFIILSLITHFHKNRVQNNRKYISFEL
jgi:hypothetical protein